MERFELNIVAQGSQSIWIAAFVVAIICMTVVAVAIAQAIGRKSSTAKRNVRRSRS